VRSTATADRDTWKRLLAFCAPEGSTATQLAKVFVRFAADHPKNDILREVLVEALYKAFPCPRTEGEVSGDSALGRGALL